MKSFLVSVFILVFVINTQAQDQELASFEWSELSNSTVAGFLNPKMAFPSKSGFTVYSIEKAGSQFYAPKVIYITKFNNGGEPQSTIDFKLPQRSQKDATLLKVIEVSDKLYFFSHVAVKKDGKNILYAQIYDNASHQVSDVIELHTIPIEKVNNSGFFEIATSDNFKSFAVLVNHPFVKKTKETITVLTLDDNLKQLSKSSHDLTFDSERAYHESVFVSNDGVVSIIKKTNIAKKHPITTLIVIADDKVKETQISSEGFYISDFRVITVSDKDYLIGFATDNAKPGISVGGAKDNSFFLYSISEREFVKKHEWSKETIKRVLGKGYIDLKVKDVLIDSAHIYLIGDCYSKDSEAIEGKNFEYNYTHRFGPGVVVKFDLDGNVVYDVPINYSEEYLNGMKVLGSFYPFLNKGKLFMLANEREYKLKNKKIVMGHNKVNAKAIVLKSFDNDGNIETIPFWNSETGGVKGYFTYAPTQTLKISEGIFYIYAIGNEMHKFGKMTLK